MAGQIRKGDVGTVLRVQVTENGQPFDASGATVTTMKLKKPSGDVVPHPAVPETTGADGWFKYVTQPDDLDEAGPWQGQMYLEGPTGAWHTEMFSFQVGDTLDVPEVAPMTIASRRIAPTVESPLHSVASRRG